MTKWLFIWSPKSAAIFRRNWMAGQKRIVRIHTRFDYSLCYTMARNGRQQINRLVCPRERGGQLTHNNSIGYKALYCHRSTRAIFPIIPLVLFKWPIGQRRQRLFRPLSAHAQIIKTHTHTHRRAQNTHRFHSKRCRHTRTPHLYTLVYTPATCAMGFI